MKDPKTPREAYQAIIDELATTVRGGAGDLVATEGIYSRAPAHKKFNQFLKSLSAEERTLVADMLRSERDGAIHDVLAALTWWLSCRDVGLTFRSKPMPFELSGEGLHGDFVGRCTGWEWPDDDE